MAATPVIGAKAPEIAGRKGPRPGQDRGQDKSQDGEKYRDHGEGRVQFGKHRILPRLLLKFGRSGVERLLLSAPRFAALSLAVVLTISLPVTPAGAAMAVVDTAAIAKLTKQLNQMREQIEQLTEMSRRLQQQIDAVGRAGRIAVPVFNAAKMLSGLRRDLNCLKPDLARLMPDVSFEDADWGSVCEAAPGYRQTLWLDPVKVGEMPTWEERNEARKAIERRRRNVLIDAVVKGLAHADAANKQVTETLEAADEIEAAAARAATSNARLAVIAQSQAVLIRAIAQATQIQAQQLRLEAALVMRQATPIESELSGEDDEDDQDDEDDEEPAGREGGRQ